MLVDACGTLLLVKAGPRKQHFSPDRKHHQTTSQLLCSLLKVCKGDVCFNPCKQVSDVWWTGRGPRNHFVTRFWSARRN